MRGVLKSFLAHDGTAAKTLVFVRSRFPHSNCSMKYVCHATFKPRFTRCERAYVAGRRSSVASSHNALTCLCFATSTFVSHGFDGESLVELGSFASSSVYLRRHTPHKFATCFDFVSVPGRRSSVATRHSTAFRHLYRQVAWDCCECFALVRV